MQTALPCFDGDFRLFPTVPVTHNPSRKQFFAKLLGAGAVVGVLPKWFAARASTRGPNAAAKTPALPFAIRPDARAVARRESV